MFDYQIVHIICLMTSDVVICPCKNDVQHDIPTFKFINRQYGSLILLIVLGSQFSCSNILNILAAYITRSVLMWYTLAAILSQLSRAVLTRDFCDVVIRKGRNLCFQNWAPLSRIDDSMYHHVSSWHCDSRLHRIIIPWHDCMLVYKVPTSTALLLRLAKLAQNVPNQRSGPVTNTKSVTVRVRMRRPAGRQKQAATQPWWKTLIYSALVVSHPNPDFVFYHSPLWPVVAQLLWHRQIASRSLTNLDIIHESSGSRPLLLCSRWWLCCCLSYQPT